MTNDLEKLLTQKPAKLLIPGSVPMTKNAREKIKQFGPRVQVIGKSAYEWYGFTLGNKDDPSHIVRNAILGKNQDVSGGHVSLDGEQVALATAEVNEMNVKFGTNYHINGWTHNHADFDTFHSGTDDENHKQVLNSASLNTESVVYRDFPLFESDIQQKLEDGKLILHGSEITDGAIEYILKNKTTAKKILEGYGIKLNASEPADVALSILNDLLQASRLTVKEPRIVGFAYSVVVNNRGDEPHCEIASITEDVFNKKKKIETSKVGLSIVQVEDDITFTTDELDKEIKEKIIFPKPTLMSKVGKWFSGKGKSRYIIDEGEMGMGGRYYVHDGKPAYQKHYPSSIPGKSKKLSLKELASKFTDSFIDYVKGWGTNSGSYKDMAAAMLGSILFENKNIADAADTLTDFKADSGTKYGTLDDVLKEGLSNRIYADIKAREKNDSTLSFIKAFAMHSDKDQVLEAYLLPKFGVGEDAIQFYVDLMKFTDDRDSKFNHWLIEVCEYMAKHEVSLESGMLARAGIKPRGYGYLSSHEQNKIKEIIYSQEISDDARAFMSAFHHEKKRDEAVSMYAQLLCEKANVNEETQLDELLTNRKSNLKQFADNIVAYANSKDQKYSLWTAKVLNMYLYGAEEMDFKKAVELCGAPITEVSQNEHFWVNEKEAADIKELLTHEKYDVYGKTLIKDFSENKEHALEVYAKNTINDNANNIVYKLLEDKNE